MKRILVLVLTLALLATSLTATASAETKLPLSEEPITLSCWVLDVNNEGKFADSKLLDWVFEKTNIRLDMTVFSMSQQEALNLRLATLEDLPDMALRLDMNSDLLADACEGGYIVELTDELLEEYAPHWAQFLAENPQADTLHRGYRVGLPNVDYVEYTGNLRDLLLMNKVWLDELNLAVPTTVSEFTAVLQAFKDNAGKGTIPKEAIPFYYQWDHRITGMFDVLGFWGITVTQTNWLAVDNGKVVFQGVNPAIKEPIKYLAELYRLGLTPAESFTDDRNMSIARTSSETPYLGFFTAFNNPNPDVYIPVAPMDTETGVKPVIRKQEFTSSGRDDFVVFSGNQHLRETLALADWLGSDPEAVANFQLGMQGYCWDWDENGKITPFTEEEKAAVRERVGEEDWKRNTGFGNFICGIRAADFYADYNDVSYNDPTSRAWAYANIYKDYVPQGETNFRKASTGDADKDQRRSDLQVEIDNLRSSMLARWITGQGDIDAEWDGYVKQMEELGLEEYLALWQQAYDTLGLN